MRGLLLGLLVLGAGSAGAQTPRTTPAAPAEVAEVTVADAMTTLLTLIEQPAPATLTREELAAYQKQTEWLLSVLTRMETVAGVTSPRDVATGQASGRKRQYAPVKLTKELGALRETVETESRQFNTLSNASKVRHDMAMHAIRNMK